MSTLRQARHYRQLAAATELNAISRRLIARAEAIEFNLSRKYAMAARGEPLMRKPRAGSLSDAGSGTPAVGQAAGLEWHCGKCGDVWEADESSLDWI